MGDLLASASLLLTLIALLYSLWYPEITKALEIEVKKHAADRLKDHQGAHSVYVSRALPLSLAGVALTVAFTPNLIGIAVASGKNVLTAGWKSLLDYDVASTSLVLVIVGSGLFSLHLISITNKLRMHVKDLSPDRQ